MYHVEYEYIAKVIHEERLREAEIDRITGAIQVAKRMLRSAADRVECLTRMQAAARPAA